MRGNRRWVRPTAPLAVAAVLLGLLAAGHGAQASTVAGQAGGDSYAVRVQGGVADRPVVVGPLSPVDARVPPETTASRRAGTVSCGGGAAACPAGAVDVLQVTGDDAVATLDPHGVGGCRPTGTAVPDDGALPRMIAPGASGCASVAHVELLRRGPLALIADAAVSRSVTQRCGAASGLSSIGALQVGGMALVGSGPVVPRPNHTLVLPPGAQGAAVAATVTLNEQLPDPGGRGLTVNAVHLHSGPAAAGAAVDVIVGHSHSSAVCPPLEVHREALPGDTTAALAAVDPGINAVDAAVARDGAPACFGGDRRGGGCHEPVAALVGRHHGLLGVTANYTDGTHALGTVIVDHRALTPNDPHTTSLCIGDATPAGTVPVAVGGGATPGACHTAVSGERLVSGGQIDIQGLADHGRRGAFWWSVRPFERTSRSLVGVRRDGVLVVAVAGPARGGHGGLTLPEAAAWLIGHDVRDAIALDGGGQADMVLAGGAHAVPPLRGAPQVQVALVVGSEPPPLAPPPPDPAPITPLAVVGPVTPVVRWRAWPPPGARPVPLSAGHGAGAGQAADASRTVALCCCPAWSSQTTSTRSPGWWARIAEVSPAAEVTLVPPRPTMASPAVSPAPSAGVPACTPTTSAPEPLRALPLSTSTPSSACWPAGAAAVPPDDVPGR
jgi:Phosphodiester glycosidase